MIPVFLNTKELIIYTWPAMVHGHCNVTPIACDEFLKQNVNFRIFCSDWSSFKDVDLDLYFEYSDW